MLIRDYGDEKCRSLERRLWKYVELSIDGHILWRGATMNNHGYITFEKKTYGVHVISAMLYMPNYTDSLWVLHNPQLCNIGTCINVQHLYQGTQKDNCSDMITANTHRNRRKTHCPRGHEYTPENTRIHNGHRSCITCSKYRILI